MALVVLAAVARIRTENKRIPPGEQPSPPPGPVPGMAVPPRAGPSVRAAAAAAAAVSVATMTSARVARARDSYDARQSDGAGANPADENDTYIVNPARIGDQFGGAGDDQIRELRASAAHHRDPRGGKHEREHEVPRVRQALTGLLSSTVTISIRIAGGSDADATRRGAASASSPQSGGDSGVKSLMGAMSHLGKLHAVDTTASAASPLPLRLSHRPCGAGGVAVMTHCVCRCGNFDLCAI